MADKLALSSAPPFPLPKLLLLNRQLIDEMVSEAKKISSGGGMTDGSEDSEEVLMAMSTLDEQGVMAVSVGQVWTGVGAGMRSV